MKKLFITLTLLFISSVTFSQWEYALIDNGFDEKYRIAHSSSNNGAFLKLEDVDGKIVFYIQGGYYCDDYPTIDLIFVINSENRKFTIEGATSNKNDAVFFIDDLMNSEMLESFQKCSFLKVRVNESYCNSNTYSFNMAKSTTALNFMLKK